MKKILSLIISFGLLLGGLCPAFAAEKSVSSDDAIKSVSAYGFVDLEGAKLSAILVEYDRDITASSLSNSTYKISDFTINQETENGGFEKVIERDWDNVNGNEGQITKVYVNTKPEPVTSGKAPKKGKYVIIEVNTAYMMSLQNLVYTQSMIAGVTQVADVKSGKTVVTAGTVEKSNYTSTENYNNYSHKNEIIRTADKGKIILPEFNENSGWKINYIGDGAFKATNCYSEYTGKYYDFDLPYAIYVPDQKIMDANKGKICLVIHMEHAGACDTDPLASLTSSRAAVKLASAAVQKENPAIVVVPQIEESRRATDDFVASSEANPAVWELLDYLLDEYKDYIDTDRIYGSGQSMGGMTLLYMASQRDNFFAGISAMGSQWSNNYNKDIQHNGAPARTPENDTVSYNGFGLDKENYQNWYYMISDDNVFVHTCAGDEMASGEWDYASQYFANSGATIPHVGIDPYLTVEEQNKLDDSAVAHDNTVPGSGISWVSFTQGGHMTTWRYGYQLDGQYKWLFAQNRQTEVERGKLEQLKNEWLGRDADGNLIAGSGTKNLNSAQFTPRGPSTQFGEGWKAGF